MATHKEQWELVCKPKLDDIHATVKNIDTWMNGNGSEGVKVRLDRIERAQAQARHALTAAWSGIVTLVGITLYVLLT